MWCNKKFLTPKTRHNIYDSVSMNGVTIRCVSEVWQSINNLFGACVNLMPQINVTNPDDVADQMRPSHLTND